MLLVLVIAFSGCSSETETIGEPQATLPANVIHANSMRDETAQAAINTLPAGTVDNASLVVVMVLAGDLVSVVQSSGVDPTVRIYDVNVFAGTSQCRNLDKREDVTPCDVFVWYMMECLNSCVGAPYCYEWCMSGYGDEGC